MGVFRMLVALVPGCSYINNNHMHYDQVKTLQIMVLTLMAIHAEGAAILIATLLLLPPLLLLKDHYYLSTASAVLCSLVAYLSSLDPGLLALFLANLALTYLLRQQYQ
jgi:hypothetical protein